MKKHLPLLAILVIVCSIVGYSVYQNRKDDHLLEEQSEMVQGIVVNEIGQCGYIEYYVQGEKFEIQQDIHRFQFEKGVDIAIGDTILVRYYPPDPGVAELVFESWFDYRN